MQNMDFYTGQPGVHAAHSQIVTKDPEYFARMAMRQHKEKEKNQNKAARTLSIVLGLCILSFTSGLIVGIKFTGTQNSEIVDNETKEAMNNLGSGLESKVSTIFQNNTQEGTETNPTETIAPQETQKVTQQEQDTTLVEKKPKEPVTKTFPKEEYPWVVKVGELFSADQAKQVADYLSSRGHTVILTRAETLYRVYLGPYKTKSTADSNVNRINNYTDNTYFNSLSVVKR